MLKKIFKFSIYFIFLFSLFLLLYYFIKVYLQNEQIVINKNISIYKKNLKDFISKKTSLEKNKIIFNDVKLKLSKLDNFLSFSISNLKISNDFGEIIFETNNLNVFVSYLDLLKNLINNEEFLFQSMVVDQIDFSIVKTNKNILLDSSVVIFRNF